MTEQVIIEYRVRPVMRYIVTRFEARENAEERSASVGSSVIGNFENQGTASLVAEALANSHAGGLLGGKKAPVRYDPMEEPPAYIPDETSDSCGAQTG